MFELLASVNHAAAANTVQALVAAPKVLRDNPRIGEKLDEFMPHEVRRILVGRYEMRYQLQSSTIYILRIWHTREER
ncbi:type II toxin-antitoxin system RelE/ParE family toxin [Serratia ficaria]|uniref:type II toxin-antitoxin system RelE/ParE family toxin n=1 Tax=Serratia ficaria TaxID=61651 RepID=UPI0037038A42